MSARNVVALPGALFPEVDLVNQQAEQSLLAILLIKPRYLEHLPGDFSSEHYGVEGHTEIHDTIAALAASGQEPTMLSVGHALYGGDKAARAYLPEIVTKAAVGFLPSQVSSYARVVTDMAKRRRMVELSREIAAMAHRPDEEVGDAVAFVQARLDLVSADAGPSTIVTMAEAVDRAQADADAACARGGGLNGLSTGLRDLDRLLGGMERQHLVILAGRPGSGKSTLGWGIALHNAERGVPVYVTSLEMSAVQLARRALAAYAGVTVNDLRAGRHAPHVDALMEAAARLRELPILIDESSTASPGVLAIKCRAARRRLGGLGLVMVDHLHRMQDDAGPGGRGDLYSKTSAISRAMKGLAKAEDVPVLLLAQLSRSVDSRDDKRPVMSDLRDSGAIEEDADAIIGVYRDEYYLRDPVRREGESEDRWIARLAEHEEHAARSRGWADLLGLKLREGGDNDHARVRFDGAHSRFYEETAPLEYAP